MKNKRRMLSIGYGSLGVLPLFVAFIVSSVQHTVPALTILWSVLLGALLTSAIGLILRARKEE